MDIFQGIKLIIFEPTHWWEKESEKTEGLMWINLMEILGKRERVIVVRVYDVSLLKLWL